MRKRKSPADCAKTPRKTPAARPKPGKTPGRSPDRFTLTRHIAGPAPFLGSEASYGLLVLLAHDPEKWVPVSRKDHAQTKDVVVIRSNRMTAQEIYPMQDRRQNTRDKVIYGGVAEIGEAGAARDCVVRNISDKGASIEFTDAVRFPREQMSLTIARKGRSFLAKVIWWRDNFVGLAFSSETPSEPASDLEERLRKSEAKKRALQRRIRELLGEG
jgi:hypothetical protein